MNDRAHIIEIQSIVLTGVDQRNPERLSGLIEAEVLRVLEGKSLRALTGIENSEGRVAREVAQVIARSVQGGADDV